MTDNTLQVSANQQLGAAHANAFRDWVRETITPEHKNIAVDLSETSYIDSCGLGALVALHKTARARGGTLRLLNPQPQVQQILELTRLNTIFETIKT